MDFISTSLSNLYSRVTGNQPESDAASKATSSDALVESSDVPRFALPADVFSVIAASLPLRDAVSLSLTGKSIESTLNTYFPHHRTTWVIVQRARTVADIPATLERIQALPFERQCPLLRELTRQLKHFPERVQKTDIQPIREALDILAKTLHQPDTKQTLSRTLALCDIGIARRLATMAALDATLRVDSNEPLNIDPPVGDGATGADARPSAAFPTEHWPAALESYLDDSHWLLMREGLLNFITWAPEYSAISDTLASALANVAFETGAPETRHLGPEVRALLTARFGVTTERQWAQVDRSVADRIAERFVQDGLVADWNGFTQACENWRPRDLAFVSLAEQSALTKLGDWVLTEREHVGDGPGLPGINATLISKDNPLDSLWHYLPGGWRS
ncbi:hypothetical protein [Robbsia sp. KACC 23696]|uniref:hypothetical protein n=1 Tax=Robbsia sp. KACC 23696 TaxID=3149231 RepID=UPI00325B760D